MENSYQLQNEQKDKLSPISIRHSVFTRILLQGTFPGVNIWLLLGVKEGLELILVLQTTALHIFERLQFLMCWHEMEKEKGRNKEGSQMALFSMGLTYLFSQQIMARNSRTALQTLTQSCACMEDTSSLLSL